MAPIRAFAGLIGQDEVRMPMALKLGAKIIVIEVSVGVFFAWLWQLLRDGAWRQLLRV